jgi:F-type H+-transporting ATPase subunit b
LLAKIALAFAEGGDNIISPDISLVVVFVLFIIFVFLMNALLFKPVSRVLDERQTLTEGATTGARAARRRYQTKLADYEASIRQARAEGYRRSEQVRQAALEERRQIIEQAKQGSGDEIARARAEIERQAAQARATLEAEARQIAERISRTVLGRTVGGGAD